MLEIKVKEARAKLGQLLNKVERGQSVTLTRRGKKVACLVALENEKHLPSLKEFRKSISAEGKELSATVITSREKDRY
jgi:prevent-host-death family protein